MSTRRGTLRSGAKRQRPTTRASSSQSSSGDGPVAAASVEEGLAAGTSSLDASVEGTRRPVSRETGSNSSPNSTVNPNRHAISKSQSKSNSKSDSNTEAKSTSKPEKKSLQKEANLNAKPNAAAPSPRRGARTRSSRRDETIESSQSTQQMPTATPSNSRLSEDARTLDQSPSTSKLVSDISIREGTNDTQQKQAQQEPTKQILSSSSLDIQNSSANVSSKDVGALDELLAHASDDETGMHTKTAHSANDSIFQDSLSLATESIEDDDSSDDEDNFNVDDEDDDFDDDEITQIYKSGINTAEQTSRNYSQPRASSASSAKEIHHEHDSHIQAIGGSNTSQTNISSEHVSNGTTAATKGAGINENEDFASTHPDTSAAAISSNSSSMTDANDDHSTRATDVVMDRSSKTVVPSTIPGRTNDIEIVSGTSGVNSVSNSSNKAETDASSHINGVTASITNFGDVNSSSEMRNVFPSHPDEAAVPPINTTTNTDSSKINGDKGGEDESGHLNETVKPRTYASSDISDLGGRTSPGHLNAPITLGENASNFNSSSNNLDVSSYGNGDINSGAPPPPPVANIPDNHDNDLEIFFSPDEDVEEQSGQEKAVIERSKSKSSKTNTRKKKTVTFIAPKEKAGRGKKKQNKSNEDTGKTKNRDRLEDDDGTNDYKVVDNAYDHAERLVEELERKKNEVANGDSDNDDDEDDDEDGSSDVSDEVYMPKVSSLSAALGMQQVKEKRPLRWQLRKAIQSRRAKKAEKKAQTRIERALKFTPERSLLHVTNNWSLPDNVLRNVSRLKHRPYLASNEIDHASDSASSVLSLADAAEGYKGLDSDEASLSSRSNTDDDEEKRLVNKRIAHYESNTLRRVVDKRRLSLLAESSYSANARRRLRNMPYRNAEKAKTVMTEVARARNQRASQIPKALAKDRPQKLVLPRLAPAEMIGVDALRCYPGVSQGIPCRVVGHHPSEGYTVEYSDGEHETIKDVNDLRILGERSSGFRRPVEAESSKKKAQENFEIAPFKGVTWKADQRDEIDSYIDALRILQDHKAADVHDRKSFVKIFARNESVGHTKFKSIVSDSTKNVPQELKNRVDYHAFEDMGRAQEIAWDCIQRCIMRQRGNRIIGLSPKMDIPGRSIAGSRDNIESGFNVLLEEFKIEAKLRYWNRNGRNDLILKRARKAYKNMSHREREHYIHTGKELRKLMRGDTKQVMNARDRVYKKLDQWMQTSNLNSDFPTSRGSLQEFIKRLRIAIFRTEVCRLYSILNIKTLFSKAANAMTTVSMENTFWLQRGHMHLRKSDSRADLRDEIIFLKRNYIALENECRFRLGKGTLSKRQIRSLWSALDSIDEDGFLVSQAPSVIDEIVQDRKKHYQKNGDELIEHADSHLILKRVKRHTFRSYLENEEKKLRFFIYTALKSRAARLQMENLRASLHDSKILHLRSLQKTEAIAKRIGIRPKTANSSLVLSKIDNARRLTYDQQDAHDWWDVAWHLNSAGHRVPYGEKSESEMSENNSDDDRLNDFDHVNAGEASPHSPAASPPGSPTLSIMGSENKSKKKRRPSVLSSSDDDNADGGANDDSKEDPKEDFKGEINAQKRVKEKTSDFSKTKSMSNLSDLPRSGRLSGIISDSSEDERGMTSKERGKSKSGSMSSVSVSSSPQKASSSKRRRSGSSDSLARDDSQDKKRKMDEEKLRKGKRPKRQRSALSSSSDDSEEEDIVTTQQHERNKNEDFTNKRGKKRSSSISKSSENLAWSPGSGSASDNNGGDQDSDDSDSSIDDAGVRLGAGGQTQASLNSQPLPESPGSGSEQGEPGVQTKSALYDDSSSDESAGNDEQANAAAKMSPMSAPSLFSSSSGSP